ncbi:CPBP family intramembrane glutamic endopeptidase [Bythopirellula polymerisocia]|uniref:CAAX amino terminal protease self-immunity n=1 Tax=Bythopirellula polymerisocia TaxID=2528003 RepID=A0A5C6CQ21_9BACT|nr:type II CAAX endopeptidase family protein [Bythopirellula polymerisocia]TWU25584.1 CAAX amino terminal protease self- immunity [Bythopirellula polymerisocia]
MSDEMSSAAFLVMFAASIASVGALLVLFERHISGKPLLAYQPRQRVPWQSGIVMLVMLLTFSGVIFSMLGGGKDPAGTPEIDPRVQVEDHEKSEEAEFDAAADSDDTNEKNATAEEFIYNSLGTTAFFMLLVGMLGVWLHVSVGANRSDLGLPSSGSQALWDIGIGIVACAASLLPIYVLQLSLTIILEPEVEHPIIEQLTENHSPAMLLAGFLLVVVAAPLGEEFVFRLLLQGWLERWEDETIGYAGSDRQFLSLHIDPTELSDLPSRGVLTTLPHGWVPILISGTLFGLAHLGHGVSPVPLVLFGIVLGYLYQRTHRLVPSITAHALFNAYSMTMLWLQLGD